MLEQQTRFSGFPWFSDDIHEKLVTIGGAGGIGSWVAFFLGRIGFKLLLCDDDKVEIHNLGGQLFNFNQLNIPKVRAVSEMINLYSNRTPHTTLERITESSFIGANFISCFDNMKARSDAFKQWKICNPDKGIFIDGRLTGEQLQIFCIRRTDQDAITNYEDNYLFDDSEVEDVACTLKQTTHSAAMIASHIVGFFTNHIANINIGEDQREVPFMYEYYIPINLTVEE